jgi:hypothetical protein
MKEREQWLELELETVESVRMKESHSEDDNASALLRQTVSNACYMHDTIAARKQREIQSTTE